MVSYTIPTKSYAYSPKPKKTTKSYSQIGYIVVFTIWPDYLAYLSNCQANGWTIRGASRTVRLGAPKTSKSKMPSRTLHRIVF